VERWPPADPARYSARTSHTQEATDQEMPADDLFAAAMAARANAYVPYSEYPVGAALRGAGGRIYAAANVENAAYPQGQCAEASAIGMLIAGGERRIVEALVVAAGEHIATPCGGCRQRLREFMALDAPLHLAGPQGIRRTVTVGELLPLSFGPEHLGKAGPR
jgi:cytidine deaminase